MLGQGSGDCGSRPTFVSSTHNLHLFALISLKAFWLKLHRVHGYVDINLKLCDEVLVQGLMGNPTLQ